MREPPVIQPGCSKEITLKLQSMKMTIGPYSITISRIQKTKQVKIDISGKNAIYKVLGEELTLVDGSVPEDLRPQLEWIIKTHFRTKV